MPNDLFSGQKVEVEGKIIFDFSNLADIYCRRLLINNNNLNNALIKLNLIDKETKIKVTIETL